MPIPREKSGMIRLRGRDERLAHGVGEGHDEAEQRWPCRGCLVAHCSCSELIIHQYVGEDAGQTCRDDGRCDLKSSAQRMADGRSLWRCSKCRPCRRQSLE
jgi:hypothetical protein